MFNILQSLFGPKDNTALKNAIKNGAILIDVRTPSEFASGSVKGAKNIPLDRLQTQLNQFKKEDTIVVFCRSGNRSGMAKNLFNQSGYQNVINGGTWTNVNAVVNE